MRLLLWILFCGSVCFPTYYDKKTQEAAVCVGELLQPDQIVMSYLDVSHLRLPGKAWKANFIIVSPGLIPTEKEGLYWLYFHYSCASHDATGSKDVYYSKIKIKVTSL